MTVPELYDLPEELRVERSGPIRTVTINRLREHNAAHRALDWVLANVRRQHAADAEARAVVLTGPGPAFSMGGVLEVVAGGDQQLRGKQVAGAAHAEQPAAPTCAYEKMSASVATSESVTTRPLPLHARHGRTLTWFDVGR